MRAFLAIPLPAPLREAFAEVARGIEGLRPLQAATIHLTLRFLDEIEDPGVIVAAVAPVVAAHPPFPMEFRSVGGFPRPRAARVLWVGLGEGDLQADALVAGIADAISPLGFRPERRPWHGHVTLGRFTRPRPVPPALASYEFGESRAEQVVLYRSTLTQSGAIHDPLAELSLGAGK